MANIIEPIKNLKNLLTNLLHRGPLNAARRLGSLDIDQPGLIQPTSIGSHSTCKQLHRRSVPRYRSVRKHEMKECKTDGSGKSSSRNGKFSRL